jgi:hypothetical protein
VVVCVGESLTVPEACELVVTFRVVDAAVAVIAIDVAFDVCHVSVTLCPESIELALAEKTRVGAFAFWLEEEPPPEQAHKLHRATGNNPKAIRRKFLYVIRCRRGTGYRYPTCEIEMLRARG